MAKATIAMSEQPMTIATIRRGRCGRVEHLAIASPINIQRNAIHSETTIGNAQSAWLLMLNAAKTSEATAMNPIVSSATPIATPRRGRRSNRRAPRARVVS